MEFWIALWTVLLWASAIAFGLVNLYIVAGAVRKFVAARNGARRQSRQA